MLTVCPGTLGVKLPSNVTPLHPMPCPPPPLQLAAAQAAYQEFYLSKHEKRRLVWQHSQGRAIVKARFAKARGQRRVGVGALCGLL